MALIELNLPAKKQAPAAKAVGNLILEVGKKYVANDESIWEIIHKNGHYLRGKNEENGLNYWFQPNGLLQGALEKDLTYKWHLIAEYHSFEDVEAHWKAGGKVEYSPAMEETAMMYGMPMGTWALFPTNKTLGVNMSKYKDQLLFRKAV